MTASLRSRLLAAPTEGWISLLLIAILAVTVAWSLDDAALVLGNRDATDFLPWVSIGGVLSGFVGARARWSRPVAHLIGAAFAALIVPIIVGSILGVGGSPAARYQAAAGSAANAVLDFAVRRLPLTRETGHYLLVLGFLCWANGQFAASAVFRHGRPIGAIIVLGTILVANMSATYQEVWFLVLFSMAALFLLTRLHALEERATWIRRRIGDPTTVGSLYLRGGTVFIAMAIFGSLVLTATARSAPLAGFWDEARPTLVDISQWLQRIIPANPNSRGLGVPSFGQQVTVGGVWNTSNDPALEIFRQPGDDRPFYWRATAYDTFTMTGWQNTEPSSVARPAGTGILDGTADQIPESAARTQEQFRIVPSGGLFRVAFSPIDPLAIDRDATLSMSGEDGYFQSIEIGRDPYTVVADVQELADVAGGLTQNRLRAAGDAYPEGLLERYTALPDGAMGPSADMLLADINAAAKADGHETPYDLAVVIVNELHKSKFQYKTNVLGVCDHDPSIVECFAKFRQGYCEHYASTMAVLLRSEGIPARIVEGFLPGRLDVATGHEVIRTSAAHAWVEVYFPGIGWYKFDPTGNGLDQTEKLIEGIPIPIATATPRAPLAIPSIAADRGDDRPSGRPVAGRASTRDGGPGNGPFVVIAVLLLAAVGTAGFLAWRRGPRSASTPEGVYASVVGLARRFGFGPRPTQTAYEYATALGEILPAARPELQTVASAKVEVAYGRRELGDERIRTLRDSYRRLRVSLLRLAFRRGDRRRMR
ncbi:MAG: transglutaminase domain-containing protein [Chloroflexi bacterium]|nr:transglutaminase domain-containing protein [Chloroflexota bacterium]